MARRGRTPRNVHTLKVLAGMLGATLLRRCSPVPDLFRLVRDDDGLRVDFMGSIHGIRSFGGLRSRGSVIRIAGVDLRVASLDDVIRRTRAADQPATEPSSTSSRRPVGREPSRRAALAALRKESERAERELIRRWKALPASRRTSFPRKRVAIRASAL